MARQASESNPLRKQIILETLVKRLEAAVETLGLVAAFGILSLVALVSTNVLLRYFAHTGSVWSQELEWHLLAPIAMLGIPYALMHGDYVRVDVIYDRFSDRTRLLIDVFATLVGMAVALLLLKYAIPYVDKSWTNGEGSPDPGGLPGRYVLKAILPLGFAVLFLQQFAHFLRNIIALKKRRSENRPTPQVN